MIGTVVSHYRVVEEIGEGAVGMVYKAEDVMLDRTVALKFLHAPLIRKQEFVARFLREANLAASLNHPNIATIYEIDESEPGRIFIAMEFIEGRNLEDVIREEGPLPLDTVRSYARQIASGLEAAHERGIIHRDIKSANLLVTPEGVVKITDFGIAKSVQPRPLTPGAHDLHKTRIGTTLGTTAYMSPEQARGEDVDHRADLWSFGMVLYELCVADLPFHGEYEEAWRYALFNTEPEHVCARRPETPQQLGDMIARLLRKNPESRFQSMKEVMEILDRLDDDAAPRYRAAPPWSPGKRIVFGASVMVGLLLIALLVQNVLTNRTSWSRFAGDDGAVRVAVLPFRNLGASSEDQYFADGMTDEMISKFSRIRYFRVIARTSVMRYKDSKKNVAEIGEELDVGLLLEGSVKKSGDRLHVNVQLADAKSQAAIWHDEYDRQLTDVFAVQDEISLAVVDKLKLRLIGGEREALEKRYTEDFDAYNDYLLGRYFWNKRTAADIQQAISYYNAAIAKDDAYPLAHAGLADSYNLMPIYADTAPATAFPQAKEHAKLALQIDERLAEAHTSLAFVQYRHDYDWTGAEISFKRAITLNPSYATAYHWYAFYLTSMGRHREALQTINQAFELDPLSLIINTDVARQLYYQRNFDAAIDRYRRTLLMDSTFVAALDPLAEAYLHAGRIEDAVETNALALQVAGPAPGRLSTGALAAAAAGDFAAARDQLAALLNIRPAYIPPTKVAAVYLALGEAEVALTWIERALQERDNWLVFLGVAPEFDALRDHGAFRDILTRLQFPEAVMPAGAATR